ncbi:MAG: hypothetical protein IPM53_08990 [Anaerolineaceae bacterium]|nr:hypothetical protein [Anaerolineaceae bacterium]
MTKEVRRFLEVYEKNLQATQRSAMFLPVPKSTAEAKQRLLTLVRIQKGTAQNLKKLITVFWSLEARERQVLVRPYLAALNTTKYVLDDVFLEARFQAEFNKDDSQLKDVHAIYQSAVIEWIKGSPLLNPQTNKDNDSFIPKVSNSLGQPYLRGLGGLRALTGTADFGGPTALPKRARAALLADIKHFKDTQFKEGLQPETEHMIGLIFLRSQLELTLRWVIDVTNFSGVQGWYQEMGQAVEVVKQDVLDIIALQVRQALIHKQKETALALKKLFQGYLATLANLYSLRGFEAGVLLTFFAKKNDKGRFAFEDEVVGVNQVKEKISAYVGVPDPDNQDRAALSVDAVLARLNELQGKEITVFGLLKGRKLTSESSKGEIRLGPVNLAGFQGPVKDRRAVVKGVLDVRGKIAKIVDPSLKPNSFAYVAQVGSPIRFQQEDLSQPLHLVPNWRQAGSGIKAEARRELEGKSISAVLAGQQLLVIDLLTHPEVITALNGHFNGKKISAESRARWRQDHMIDLNDLAVRTLVWTVLFKKFLKQNKNKAFASLFAFMNQYLKHYTRHTYFNVRDSGKNYLLSNWPTDLLGCEFFDCGVYALRMAFDIQQAVTQTSVKVEFRFLTFLNHIALIGYFDNQSFLVNNDRIYLPKPIPKSAADAQLEAGFNWAINAFSTVYDVRFTIFVAVMPVGSLLSDTSSFESKIWQMYQNSLWWGLANHRATPTSNTPSYYDEIQLFNQGSLKLETLLTVIREKNPAASSPLMGEATDLAAALYDLANRLADPANFVAEKKSVNFIPAIGFGSPQSSGKRRASGLPMYEMVDLLKKKSNLSHKQKQLIGSKVRQAHVAALTAKFALNKKP